MAMKEENGMIELQRISKRFGRKTVLENVSFAIRPNEIACLVGMNGIGKTTLMNCMMGLTPLDTGKILLDGKEMKAASRYDKIAYIMDSIHMPQNWTVREAMDFMAEFYPNWNGKKASELLDFFQLKEEEKIRSHSKGNKAKVNFLLGLGLDADYYLMDEPLSGIDVFAREQIMEVFTSKFVANKGVLLSTHHIDEMEFLVDRLIMLKDGSVQRDIYAEQVREEEGKSVMDVLREVYQP